MVVNKLDVLSKAGLTKECMNNTNTVNFESSKSDQKKLDSYFKELMEDEDLMDDLMISNLIDPSVKENVDNSQDLDHPKTRKINEDIDISKSDRQPVKKVKI